MGVLSLQLRHQQGQVFAHMFTHAQEHGHHADVHMPRFHRLGHGLWQAGLGQFQISASHPLGGGQVADALGHGQHRALPSGVTRAMGE